ERVDLFVDLWSIDGTDATPQWRRRIATIRDGAMIGRSLLGADGYTMWVLDEGKLEGYSVRTGDRTVRAGRLEEIHEALRGLMPTDAQYFGFDHYGLHLKAADGRDWYVDGTTLEVWPPSDAASREATASVPAFASPEATHLFQARKLDIPGRWLGVLTDG